ncbi:valine--tRNA ligase [Stomatohabitans albus]|uniref:valine--tRNA ligase n=1 Tax=Stomatohabitans albus TaxID=3110766 RepID=UPI00300C6146
MTLARPYEPDTLETPLYSWWETSKFFHAEPGDEGEPFAIVIPPPNVTGVLHVGHALDMTFQDVFTRRARMQGKNAVWFPGTDHAGIATQVKVEQQLAEEGLSRRDLGREQFLERVWAWREQSGGEILRQLRRLGASCDWDREAFTLDEQRNRAVRKVFCDYYDRGLIYRGLRLINWDPVSQSAISDIEVEHKTVQGTLTYFTFRPADEDGTPIVVATTRPETLLGDTGVAVNPKDERYSHMIGKEVLTPFTNRRIPVVADDHVDREFGTGAVKVTPAHDPNDWQIGERHHLEVLNVMNPDATINEQGGVYAGMDRFEARKQIVKDLERDGLLVKVEPHEHQVGHSDRTKVPIEPRLSEQWFVDTSEMAKRALEASERHDVVFVPERGHAQMREWLGNTHDWCISRQLWWGHQIPAWYDREGNVHVHEEDPSPDEIERLGLTRDPDVLDTWFSSGLWPFVIMGWPEHTPELATWYPTSVLVTGYDINTFWVSRMLMMALTTTNQLPFSTVVNHGLVRDKFGAKMSKSLGNVMDPIELIDKHGADALRFALLRSATPGSDVPIAEEWVEGGRRFANKLWNVARMVTQTANGIHPDQAATTVQAGLTTLEDRWIISRLHDTIASVNTSLDGWDISPAVRRLYHFIWDEFADWYLELAKGRTDDQVKAVLVHVLDVAMRALHPMMPFVTEVIWRSLRGLDALGEADTTTIMRAAWPTHAGKADADAEATFKSIQDGVTELRRLRANYNLSPRTQVKAHVQVPAEMQTQLEAAADGICRLAGIETLTISTDVHNLDGVCADVPVGQVVYTVSLDGLVDTKAEQERLAKELTEAKAELKRAEGKLANERFVANAPKELVDAERAKVEQWTAAIATLTAQLEN